MMCPHCNGPTKTLDTREVDRYVRRRRQCQSCRRRFTTAEGVVDDYASSNIMMVQRKVMEDAIRALAATFTPGAPGQVTQFLEMLSAPASREVPDA